MVVYTDSPKAVAEPEGGDGVPADQPPAGLPGVRPVRRVLPAGLQLRVRPRRQSRFEEAKVKNPKKDLGPHVYLYADRCIMCTRCVRFTREVTGTAELLVQGRGNKNEIDIFPGIALDNELSANVVDLCPVGALLDKDFLFTQRVWFLKETPSIDGITASGDNIRVDHNDGKVYRFKPRTNMKVNKWWITDEVRYRLEARARRGSAQLRRCGGSSACRSRATGCGRTDDAITGIKNAIGKSNGGRLGVVVSPMLSCEDAYWLGRAALAIDPRAMLVVGPVPRAGMDRVYPGAKESDLKAFKVYAEKAPNARGVKRVLEALVQTGDSVGASVSAMDSFVTQAKSGAICAAIVTGNYPSDWITDELARAVDERFVVVIDTLSNRLTAKADVVLPGASWLEKAGTFQNARDMIQAFEQAIPPVGLAKPEAQIGLDILAILDGVGSPLEETETIVINAEKRGQVPGGTHTASPVGRMFNAADTRLEMSGLTPGMAAFATEVAAASLEAAQEADMEVVEL